MRLIDKDEILKRKADVYDNNGHLLLAVTTGEIWAAKTVDAVPLDIISKKLGENVGYPPCEDNRDECRKCELTQKYGVQRECWRKYLKGLVEDDGLGGKA